MCFHGKDLGIASKRACPTSSTCLNAPGLLHPLKPHRSSHTGLWNPIVFAVKVLLTHEQTGVDLRGLGFMARDYSKLLRKFPSILSNVSKGFGKTFTMALSSDKERGLKSSVRDFLYIEEDLMWKNNWTWRFLVAQEGSGQIKGEDGAEGNGAQMERGIVRIKAIPFELWWRDSKEEHGFMVFPLFFAVAEESLKEALLNPNFGVPGWVHGLRIMRSSPSWAPWVVSMESA